MCWPVIGVTDDLARINDWINDWTMTDFGPHKKSMTGVLMPKRASVKEALAGGRKQEIARI